MNKLTCTIIEDQIAAQRLLADYIGQTPGLMLLNKFIDPLEGLNALAVSKPDILFLDIHLPKLSGLELLKTMTDKPRVILTTAFAEYAVEGFNLDVTDYLLKPFSFERFLQSISKVNRDLTGRKPLRDQNEIFVKEKNAFVRIAIDNILYLESKGDFSVIVTNSKNYIVDHPLKLVPELFGKQFIRCHKSFVVNTENIERIDGNLLVFGKHKIPIGRTYKRELMNVLGL